VTIYEYKGIRPRLGREVFLAPGVIVLGDVQIGDYSNLWFYTVIRADVHYVRIGERTNIQDHCVLHVTGGRYPLTIGNGVIVGHHAVLHGCTIYDDVLISMAGVVMDGAVVEQGAIVAAGAVVTPGTVIPANRVAVGIPARPTREVTPEELAGHRINSSKYQNYAQYFNELVKIV